MTERDRAVHFLIDAMSESDQLEHHGIKGMKWGIRRTPEQLGHKNKGARHQGNRRASRSVASMSKEQIDSVASGTASALKQMKIKRPTDGAVLSASIKLLKGMPGIKNAVSNVTALFKDYQEKALALDKFEKKHPDYLEYPEIFKKNRPDLHNKYNKLWDAKRRADDAYISGGNEILRKLVSDELNTKFPIKIINTALTKARGKKHYCEMSVRDAVSEHLYRESTRNVYKKLGVWHEDW